MARALRSRSTARVRRRLPLPLETQSGIASANGAGAITFSDDVTIAAGNTATTLINAVTNLDGLTFTSDGDVTFGNAAGTDQVNLTTAAVTITTTGRATT